MRKKKLLKITLKSDLCSGSGFAFAGVIDSDVQHDRYGIPCISGRSLKGCLKESAVTLLSLHDNELCELFGIGGSDTLTGIEIGNAYPENAQQIRDEIDALTEDYKIYAGTQNVLSYYTNVRAQTSIDEEKGSAKENTLRFTRVVNHYSDEQEMVFLAPVEFDDNLEDILAKAVKSTRHIGSNRNRGMGNVMMELVPRTEGQCDSSPKTFDREKRQKISFCVKNTAPLMLSQSADSSSESYIGGNLVLGVLAGRYLSVKGHSANDQAFKKLFLSDETQYSNLSLAELTDQGWSVSEPVPMYVMRKKKTRNYVNILQKDAHDSQSSDDDKKKDFGNQPQKVRNHWLFRDQNDQPVKVTEVERDIVYHHAKHKENKKGQEGLLYYFETISPNQYFAGDIVIDGCYAELMIGLLEMGDFHFGKSRTAQYGTCKLIDDIKISDYEPKEDIFEEKERIVITFLSDAIFTDELGNDTVKCDKVRSIVANTLNIPHAINKGEGAAYDLLMTKVITGYNTKWNLQKPQRIGIKAGSALVFELNDYDIIKSVSLGENRREGFGRIRVDIFDNMQYDVCKNDITDQDQEDNQEPEEKIMVLDAAKPILKESILNTLNKVLLKPVFDCKSEQQLNIKASTLGRLSLMLTEVINESKDSKSRLIALNERIESIKDKEKVRAIKTYIHSNMGLDEESIIEHFISIIETSQKKKKKESTEEKPSVFEILTDLIGDAEAKKEVFDLWPQYLSAVLTCQKYRMKQEV